MSHSESESAEPVPSRLSSSINVASWRYQGERAAADLAYCTRFGVTEAPEPGLAPGGILIYALPVAKPTR